MVKEARHEMGQQLVLNETRKTNSTRKQGKEALSGPAGCGPGIAVAKMLWSSQVQGGVQLQRPGDHRGFPSPGTAHSDSSSSAAY